MKGWKTNVMYYNSKGLGTLFIPVKQEKKQEEPHIFLLKIFCFIGSHHQIHQTSQCGCPGTPILKKIKINHSIAWDTSCLLSWRLHIKTAWCGFLSCIQNQTFFSFSHTNSQVQFTYTHSKFFHSCLKYNAINLLFLFTIEFNGLHICLQIFSLLLYQQTSMHLRILTILNYILLSSLLTRTQLPITGNFINSSFWIFPQTPT